MKSFVFVIFLMVFQFFFIPLHAKKMTLVSEDVSMDIELTGFPEIFEKDLISDLEWLASIPYQGEGTPLHQKIFRGPVQGKTYLKWFGDRVHEIKADFFSGYSSYVLAYNRTESLMEKISLFQKHAPFFKDQIYVTLSHFVNPYSKTPGYRMATLFHEARHGEGYGHVTCPDPKKMKEKRPSFPYLSVFTYHFMDRKDVCDETEEGPRGIEVIFLANLAKFQPNAIRNDMILMSIYSASHIVSSESRHKLYQDVMP